MNPAPDPASPDLSADVTCALAGAAGTVFVGFSGGLDSAVLLHAAVGAGLAPRLVAVHVNHGLHADASAWQHHCEHVAAAAGIRCLTRAVVVPSHGSLEAAARAVRYAVFADCLALPDARLLLAHHRDDQAETVLMRLFQGRGLYGMPAARALGAGRLLRPLLQRPRRVLEAYARRHGLVWLEDPSNVDLGLDRNFIRHRIMPDLRQRFPGVQTALLAAMAQRQAEEALLTEAPGSPIAGLSLAIDLLLARGAVEQVTWLRLWLSAHGVPVPPQRALLEFIRQLGAPGDRQPRLQIGAVEVRRHGGQIWLVGPAPALASTYSVTAPGRLRLPHGELDIVRAADGFACHGALQVRFRDGGERILVGGRHRLVKHLFQARGVPPWARHSYPLLFDERGIAAVPGLAVRAFDGAPDAPRFVARWQAGG